MTFTDVLIAANMKLNEFIEARFGQGGEAKRKAAGFFGVSLQSIYRYLDGSNPGSVELTKIVHRSGGLVGISDLITEKPSTLRCSDDVHNGPDDLLCNGGSPTDPPIF